LNRRIGQTGNVFQRGFAKGWNPALSAFGRYWIDLPGCEVRKRHTVSLGICATRSLARRKLREHIEREGVNGKASFMANTFPALTFREQAEKWIASLPTRRRKPVKPATVFGWRHALDKWILPTIGDMPLADVSNAALKLLIETMAAGGLSAKTIVSYSLVVKLVVASAVDAEGEQIYPRKWNHDFIGMPIVQKEKQYRPTVTETQIEELLNRSPYRFAVLFALLAGTGLRAGEALALRPSDFSPDFRVLHVTRSIWHGQEQDPKTPAAIREVDIAEPLAALIRVYAQGKTGYLFATWSGRPISQRNINRAAGVALHAFRRFRTETLRRNRVPEDLIDFWLGHASRSITDLYANGLKNDRQWRLEWCDRVGLGFSLVGLHGLQNVAPIDSVKAA
jgi:integrase